MSELQPRRRAPRRDGKNNQKHNTNHDGSLVDGNLASSAVANNHLANDKAVQSDKNIGKILPWMRLEKPMGLLSLLLVAGSIVAIALRGLNLGLDFTGGVSSDVHFANPTDQGAVVSALEQAGFADPVVQYLGSRQDVLVRLPPQDDIATLSKRLSEALSSAGDATISSMNVIGSQVGNEIYLNSLLALALALGCMLAYVALRFEWKLAVGAILALFHDAIVVIGVFALFGFPFDLTVLAAILALVGYSINDTIVVYDRIRENFRRVRGLSPRMVVDLSLTETLRRTIMTISTVLLVVIAMLFLGGVGLLWFSVALLIGLIAGTYSSIYIASSIPLWLGLSREDFIVKVKPEFSEESVVFETQD